jgi:glutamine amidotransferase
VRADARAVTVASEPHDELPGWAEVPQRHLVAARAGRADLRPIIADVRTEGA